MKRILLLAAAVVLLAITATASADSLWRVSGAVYVDGSSVQTGSTGVNCGGGLFVTFVQLQVSYFDAATGGGVATLHFNPAIQSPSLVCTAAAAVNDAAGGATVVVQGKGKIVVSGGGCPILFTTSLIRL